MNNEILGVSEKLGLLVIDVQKPFVDAIVYPPDFLKRVSLAVDAAKCLGIKIFISEQMPDKLGPTLTELTQIAQTSAVFHKSSFSALRADGLLDSLREEGIEHLMICGLEVPICVYQTALALSEEGFGVTLLKDALGARREADCAPIWDTLSGSGCYCLPVEAVIYSILRDADHDKFKAITALVKKYF